MLTDKQVESSTNKLENTVERSLTGMTNKANWIKGGKTVNMKWEKKKQMKSSVWILFSIS